MICNYLIHKREQRNPSLCHCCSVISSIYVLTLMNTLIIDGCLVYLFFYNAGILGIQSKDIIVFTVVHCMVETLSHFMHREDWTAICY